MSSTSNEVCELFDGKKVVRLEGTKPLIQELIYAGEWYDLITNRGVRIKGLDLGD
jgi:hypothetical protein